VSAAEFFNADFAFDELDGNQKSRRNFRGVYPGKFNFGTFGKLRSGFAIAFKRLVLCNCGGLRRHRRFNAWKPTFQFAGSAARFGGRFADCRFEVDSYLKRKKPEFFVRAFDDYLIQFRLTFRKAAEME
jgi:hypothetical protein